MLFDINGVRSLLATLAFCFLPLILGCEESRGVYIAGEYCDRLFVHELGDVIVEPNAKSPPLEHTFRFTNPSAAESMKPVIEIKSCGCVEASLRDAQIPPGESGAVTIAFHPAYGEELRSETLVIKTGLKSPARYAFRLVANIHPRICFENRDSLEMAVRPHQTATARVEIIASRSADEADAELKLTSLVDWITIEPVGSAEASGAKEVISESRTFRIRANLPRSHAQGGRVREEGQLVAHYGSWHRRRTVRVVHEPYITRVPARLFLRADNSKEVRYIVLSATEPFEILEIQNPQRLLDISANRLDKKHVRLSVSLASAERNELPPKVNVLLTTNHPKQKAITIPVFLFGDKIASATARDDSEP